MSEQVLHNIAAGREWVTRAHSSLSPQQKMFLFRGLPVLLLALGIGVYFLNHVAYRPLFTNLSQQDAAAVMRELDSRRIPYHLRSNGSVIEVPEDILYRTRIELAGKGIPLGGGVGFEIFEQTPFGTTEFTQRVNFQRALQGELARTINSIQAVQSSRVHLALPAHAGFLGREEKPSASVIVELRPGYSLTSEQVQGITNLLATSVEGLSPEKISVVDTSGRPLRARGEKNDTETEFLHRLKLQIEQEMEKRIETMLEPVLGAGKAVARVSAELEFRETQLAREQFDPASHVVRSQQQQLEDTQTPQTGGVPGVQGAVPGGDTGQGKNTTTNRKNETVNYEIGRTTSQVLEPRGQVRRLSIAVMVDGKYEADTYTSRPTEEMELLKAIVMKAVGFNSERGDQVEVANMAFTKVDVTPLSAGDPVTQTMQWLQTPVGMGAVAGGIVLLLLLLKVIFKRKPAPVPAPDVAQEQVFAPTDPLTSLTLAQSKELAEAQVRVPDDEEEQPTLPESIEKIIVSSNPHQVQLAQIAQDYPEMTAQLIRLWLHEGKKPTSHARLSH